MPPTEGRNFFVKVRKNLNPHFVSVNFLPCFFSLFSSFIDEKWRYNYHNGPFTPHYNSNVQSDDKRQSKLNGAVNANNGLCALKDDAVMKILFNENNVATIKNK